MYSNLQNLWYVIKNTYRWQRIILVYILIQAFAGVLMSAFGIYLPNMVLLGVTNSIPIQRMLFIVSGMAVGMALCGFVSNFLNSIITTNLMNNKIRYLTEMFKKKMDADYQNIESPEGQLLSEKGMGTLFNDSTGVCAMITALGGLITAILGFFLYSGIISTLNLLIVIILIATSLSHYFVLRTVASYEHRNREHWAPLDKRINYLTGKMSDYSFGKDIRLYSMRTWLTRTLDAALKARQKWAAMVAKRNYLTAVSDVLVIIIRDGAAYILLFSAIINGKIGIADFVLYFGAITGFSGFITQIIQGMSTINRTSLDVCAMREFLEMPDRPCGSRVLSKEEIQEGAVSIEFRHVSFRYTDDIIQPFRMP